MLPDGGNAAEGPNDVKRMSAMCLGRSEPSCPPPCHFGLVTPASACPAGDKEKLEGGELRPLKGNSTLDLDLGRRVGPIGMGEWKTFFQLLSF